MKIKLNSKTVHVIESRENHCFMIIYAPQDNPPIEAEYYDAFIKGSISVTQKDWIPLSHPCLSLQLAAKLYAKYISEDWV